MRGLIVRKPWIDFILENIKPWEMRTQDAKKIRGRIALIEQGTGLIVGETNLVDSIPGMSHEELITHTDKHLIEDEQLLKKWNVAWVLENSKRYEQPIRYIHPPGAVIWVKNLKDRLV
ncbi:hypothetical protein EI16_12275 [Hydrogenovibrio marinus]|uniref:ASCH domain-containing protein n=1 Tax=Hydrogenovibrio marinus TaxID=28885 RepID=A0A066ZLK1_HYDMR|nr:hypothetical protein EI16_12275 [Hydrogenovibrio marinus]